jgi:hypothetical protein
MKNNFALNIKANPWVAKLEQEEEEEEVDPAWSSTPPSSSLPYNKQFGKVDTSRGPDPKPAEILPATKEQSEMLIEYLIQGYKADWKNISVFGYLGNTFRQIRIGISSVTVPLFDQCLFSIQETTHSEAYGCETRDQLLSNLTNGTYRCFWTFCKLSDGQIGALVPPRDEEVD